MKKVFIDAGHGGKDPGATGNNLKEKDITLSVAKLIELELKQQGVEVLLSRSNDSYLTLDERTNKANKWGADALISIHCNDAENKTAQGIETFCYKFKYRKLADCVHNELLTSKVYTKDRGVKEANLHMVRESKMSACLTELAFIGNTQDAELLKTKQNVFAKAIAKGICKYLGIVFKDNSTSLPKDFDPVKYLVLNQDVLKETNKQSTFSAEKHYLEFGIKENRKYK